MFPYSLWACNKKTTFSLQLASAKANQTLLLWFQTIEIVNCNIGSIVVEITQIWHHKKQHAVDLRKSSKNAEINYSAPV